MPKLQPGCSLYNQLTSQHRRPPHSQTVAADKQFLSRKETAELLKVDFSTLWRWNKSGILKSVKVGPRRVLYKYDDVMNILTLGGA